jgi:thymidylate synthase (FAD)
MTVRLIWSTPDGDNLIAYMARVSNPSNQGNGSTAAKLIRYLIKNRHWSPFEMVNACFEIKTSRAIGRQLLRHRSFSFQEFSQRYAEVTSDNFSELKTEARTKGTTNRQSSIPDNSLNHTWSDMQCNVYFHNYGYYEAALKTGIAPELARNLLPEGLTPTTLYMNGTLRSWLHYIAIRTDEHTQREHRDIALEIAECLRKEYPNTFAAFDETHFKHEMGSKTP